ncbi:FAD-binding domain-containing protein [Rhodosalinus sp. 5P4]|uniref:FAD-binding domain-containing protein n=1 Tax=Rhodosalinus sp. 5P4 TaxID=3239196 RepID=UPI003523371B
MQALTQFPPARAAGLARLARFVPRAGTDYARRRNVDLGPGRHDHVSGLSPWLRRRLVTEEELLASVLGRHSPVAARKFVEEVFWRAYWKGWLERRPAVWTSYRAGLLRALDRVQTEAGLRQDWAAACRGETGIDCFDAWARELATTGYLHNHARMWFASIWIFTLRLPWELGADVFLRHLLDGDPASNTLGWRWVAGLQTPGRTYLARPGNIEKCTGGRFRPEGLAAAAPALEGPPAPPPRPVPESGRWDPGRATGLLLTEEDLAPGPLFEAGLAPRATAVLSSVDGLSPLAVAPHLLAFVEGAIDDATARWAARLGPVTRLSCADDIAEWAAANGIEQVVTPYPPVGPAADALAGRDVIRILRPYDAAAWPHATQGFSSFRARIPSLLDGIGRPAA